SAFVFILMMPQPLLSTLFPYTTLFRSGAMPPSHKYLGNPGLTALLNTFFHAGIGDSYCGMRGFTRALYDRLDVRSMGMEFALERSEEHTSELQSPYDLVCRLLLEKKKE